MTHTTLKVTISLICASVVAIHLGVPTLKVDGVTLGLIAIGLLPWFQPLVKSFELPGGLKIELQEVKEATAKISASAGESAIKPLDTSTADEFGVSRLRNVAEQDPNLAFVALRLEIEKLLVDLAQRASLQVEKRGATALLSQLTMSGVIPEISSRGLAELIALGNQAAHGAVVSKDAALWAIAKAPELLGILSAIRSTLKNTKRSFGGVVSKAEVLAASVTHMPIPIKFEKPFIRPPNVVLSFRDMWNADLSSGALRVIDTDENGFQFEVVSMPEAHTVVNWSVKWQATGEVE